MAAPFDVLAAAVVPWTGRPSTVRHRFLAPILFRRAPGWKGKSHERTPGGGLLGAYGLFDRPIGALRRVRAEARATRARGAPNPVRASRARNLAGDQPRRALAQVTLEGGGVGRLVAVEHRLGGALEEDVRDLYRR